MGQRREIPGRLAVAEVVDAPNQFDDIAAALAAGKAVPNVFREVGAKGVGVIAAVHRAGPDEAVAASAQGAGQAFGGEHLLERDQAFESSER
jgi:hypothetical protein